MRRTLVVFLGLAAAVLSFDSPDKEENGGGALRHLLDSPPATVPTTNAVPGRGSGVSRKTSYVVVVLSDDGDQIPEVIGPYRSFDRALAEANRWDNPSSDEYIATVRPLEWGPSLRRYLGVSR